MRTVLIILVMLAIIALAIYVWRGDDVASSLDNDEANVFCTADAMMCPDGSYVGRVPPTCEFAACPANTTNSNVNVEAGLNGSLQY